MGLIPMMTPQIRQSLGKILNSYIPDWVKLEIQAKQAIKNQKPFIKTSWNEADAYRTPIIGMDHDIWKIDEGICLQRHPTLIEKIIAMMLGLLDILLAPLRALQRKIEETMFNLSSKLGQFGGILAIPFAILLMIIDFFRIYLMRLLRSITSPIVLIFTILSLPFWIIKTLFSRLIQALMAPLLANILAQVQKTQQALVAFLAKYGWLRGIMLGMIRDGNRPDLPIVIPKKGVTEVVLKNKWSLFGSKMFLLIIEGDKLKPGLSEYISLKMKQIFFPYYWERTVHMILMPKAGAEKVRSAFEDALRHDGTTDEIIEVEVKEQISPELHGVHEAATATIAAQTARTLTPSTNVCPKCNASFDQSKKFCGKCGVPLVTGTSTSVVQETAPQEVTYVSQSVISAPSVKTNRKAKWFLGVFAAALCLGAIVIYFNHRDVPVSQPSAKPQAPTYVPPVKIKKVDSDTSQEKQGSLEQYRNMYEPSEINYAQKYPLEFDMLYALLKETFEKKELEDAINRKASQLDQMHLDKIRFFAAPTSVEQQKQQHIDYVPKLVNDDTLKEGLRFFDEYKDTIMNAYSKYKVTPQDIIAVINWESKFGKYKGEYSVYKVFVGNLFHISEMEKQFYDEGGYDKKDIMPRDKALSRIEKLKKRAAQNLAALLKLSIKKNFNPYEIKGSWAGAIGIPQFMPPSMVYAADGDGDAEIDLNNMHDAIFSVASFLNQHAYTDKGSKYALTKYNPEEMYVRGVSLYSSLIMEKGLSY